MDSAGTAPAAEAASPRESADPIAPAEPGLGQEEMMSAMSPAAKKERILQDAQSLQCPIAEKISELRAEQQKVKNAKKKLAAEIRNAEKKKQRLRKRARMLTDADLVQVLVMRRKASSSEGSVPSEPNPRADTASESASADVSP